MSGPPLPRELVWAWAIAGGLLLWVIIIVTVAWMT
jgi:hypothetical protein